MDDRSSCVFCFVVSSLLIPFYMYIHFVSMAGNAIFGCHLVGARNKLPQVYITWTHIKNRIRPIVVVVVAVQEFSIGFFYSLFLFSFDRPPIYGRISKGFGAFYLLMHFFFLLHYLHGVAFYAVLLPPAIRISA